MSRVALAAITFDERGGGVAAASRLMWRAMRDRWGHDARLVTLVPNSSSAASLETSTGVRLQFGARLARAQVMTECRWIFYTHVSIAQVQRFVPSALRRPYGVFLHGIEVWGTLTPTQRRALEDAAVRIANSQYTADRVREAHPWIGPIVTCPLALGDPEAKPGLVDAVPDVGPHAVLLVARMESRERYKGHDQLLDVWADVVAQVPDAKLVFVGSGDDEDRLRRKAEARGLMSRVLLTGFVAPEVRTALYRRAALLAMPSRGEGFGLVYLEAMAHGLPCIGSIHDAACGVIEDGKTGFLVDQSDLTDLRERLLSLLTDPSARLAMGALARQRLQARFSYEAFRERFIGALQASLGEPESVMSVLR